VEELLAAPEGTAFVVKISREALSQRRRARLVQSPRWKISAKLHEPWLMLPSSMNYSRRRTSTSLLDMGDILFRRQLHADLAVLACLLQV
jgi:hypothetical protein